MRFGIGFAVLILIHEMGHYVDIKRRGLAGGDAGIFAGLRSSRAMFTDDFQEEIQVSDPTLGLILIGTLGGSLEFTYFREENCFFLITCVQLQPARFIDQTADSGSGDVVFPCNAGQRHLGEAVNYNLCPVDIQAARDRCAGLPVSLSSCRLELA